ncbi:hypothetical protein ACIRU8_27130 [Streptomyces sp. NPDC101175]|uniref:hypothetical protein n=1 Tax=Streptomyces sp. NPDC101175 TaxID=3366123 RepID=UPI003835AA20
MDQTCVPEANTKVGVLYETDAAADLAAQSYDATAGQTPVRNAVASRSSCTASDGHRVKSLDDTEGRFPAPEMAGLKPAAAEVSLANYDIDPSRKSPSLPSHLPKSATPHRSSSSPAGTLQAAAVR